MFDRELIRKLSPDDVLIIMDLLPLAKWAKEAEKKIKEKYTFKIGEEKIMVWSDGPNCEYLTHEGVWQARYLHQSYDMVCSAEEIFKYAKASYLIENGYEEELTKNGEDTAEGGMAQVFRYFKSFLKRN